jgi:hypothetical protein
LIYKFIALKFKVNRLASPHQDHHDLQKHDNIRQWLLISNLIIWVRAFVLTGAFNTFMDFVFWFSVFNRPLAG